MEYIYDILPKISVFIEIGEGAAEGNAQTRKKY